MSRFVLALSALFLAAPALAADSVGATGFVSQVDVNTASGETYLVYHGRLFVDTNGVLAEYRWGGTSCGTRRVSDPQIALLESALIHAASVTPRWVLGQGEIRCLVGFAVRS